MAKYGKKAKKTVAKVMHEYKSSFQNAASHRLRGFWPRARRDDDGVSAVIRRGGATRLWAKIPAAPSGEGPFWEIPASLVAHGPAGPTALLAPCNLLKLGLPDVIPHSERSSKHGELKIGAKGGKVKRRKQAIAIGLAEARRKGEKVPPKKRAGKREEVAV